MVHKHIPKYVFASIAVALGGLLNGYDTGAIGAITTMSQWEEVVGKLSPSLIGSTVSIIMLAGAIPSVFAGNLADKHGRIKVILAGAIIFGIGAIVQGSSMSLPQFLVGRAFSGLGEGVYLSTMAVYICEIAPMKYRGVLAGLPQFAATAGVCFGYFTCYGTVGFPSSIAWRMPYLIQGIVTTMLIASCLVLPDSPRWLMLQGKREEALQALTRLDFSLDEANRDFMGTSEQQTSLSLWQNITILFRRGYRARTILALFVLGMVQLSGIDGVLYYAPVLFSQAGLPSQTASFLASGLSTILMLAISIPAFLLADNWGRRTSALTGGFLLAGCMLLIGSLYASNAVHPYGIARWVVIISVFIFGLAYCATWGIVGKIYATEIQPSNTRAAANCIAQGLGFFTNWLVAILTPILLDKSAFGAYFLFGGLALGTTAVLAEYMPETRGRSLENIQEAFSRPGIKNVASNLRRRITRQLNPALVNSLGMDTFGAATPAAANSSADALSTGLRVGVAAGL
ncbi:general substrate transporter [Bisporella sp. PMI_857]|nr:general substrate transporter [Bisporella sp. PMI_857]